MVALASDWRIAEQRAHRLLSPARVLARYRQIVGAEAEKSLPSITYQQMLSVIASYEADDHERPDDAQEFPSS